MTTQQNDTAALTDEQLEGVAGGGRIPGSYVSISPVPVPTSTVFLPGPPWGPCVTSSPGWHGIAPLPSP